jgi:hypothetical protein
MQPTDHTWVLIGMPAVNDCLDAQDTGLVRTDCEVRNRIAE